MRYSVADAHVDVLMRMVEEKRTFYDEPTVGDSAVGSYAQGIKPYLQAGFRALQAGGVRSQVFALYVSPKLPDQQQLVSVLSGIDAFYHDVVREGAVQAVTSRATLSATQDSGQIAGLLSIEGAGCLLGNPAMLRVFFKLGVRGLGLTWNPGNLLADGCGEARNGGLTNAGRDIVREAQRLPMWLDLAHLGDASTEDVLSLYPRPIMASHANARSVHAHRRNLTDDVIAEIVRRKGWMGLTFESSFLGDKTVAHLDSLGAHIDHVLGLGGIDCLGFGSDFDGGITPIAGVPTAAQYQVVGEWLARRYGDDITRKLLSENFHRFLHLILE